LRSQYIASSVGVSESIEECLKRSLEELHKGFLGCEFSGSAKDAVFENVWYTGGISGWGSEGDTEYLQWVVIGEEV